MKIHHDGRLPGMAQTVPKGKGGSSSASFADVLAQTAPTQQPMQITAATATPQTIQPAATAPSELHRTTERALNAMERYQQLLADSGVNLRNVEPAVRALQREINALEPLMGKMPEDHPVLQVARQTLLTASKEIARFDRGNYIDD